MKVTAADAAPFYGNYSFTFLGLWLRHFYHANISLSKELCSLHGMSGIFLYEVVGRGLKLFVPAAKVPACLYEVEDWRIA
jgi:hypothetical protein